MFLIPQKIANFLNFPKTSSKGSHKHAEKIDFLAISQLPYRISGLFSEKSFKMSRSTFSLKLPKRDIRILKKMFFYVGNCDFSKF